MTSPSFLTPTANPDSGRTDTTPQFEMRQDRAGSTFYVRVPATKQELWPPKGTSWTQDDAKREGQRLIAQPSNRAICPICKKFIGGEVIRCTCPLTTFDTMAVDDLIAAIRTLATGAETRLRNVAGTAQLDRLERKDLTFTREDLRSIQVAVSELAARVAGLDGAGDPIRPAAVGVAD